MIRYILCSFAFVLLYPTAIDLYLVGLPQIAADLGATTSHLHYAFSIYLAGMATTMWLAGKLADRVGRKPVAIVGGLTFCLTSLLAASSSEPMLFFVARFGQGVGAGATYVVAFAVLRDKLDEERRAKVLSMLNGITCVLPVIAPVAGHLIMVRFPWQSLFITMAIMGSIVTLTAVFLFKETKSSQAAAKIVEQNYRVPKTPQVHESLWQPVFVSRVVLGSIAMMVILTYVNVSPMLIMDGLGFSRGQYSTVMTCTALVSMATSFLAPIMIARFTPTTMMLSAQFVILLAAALLWVGCFAEEGTALTLTGFCLVGMSFALGVGVITSQALSPFQQRAGVASSVLAIIQMCSAASYIWLMGMVSVSPLMMLVGLLVCGALVSIGVILAPIETIDDQTVASTGP